MQYCLVPGKGTKRKMNDQISLESVGLRFLNQVDVLVFDILVEMSH